MPKPDSKFIADMNYGILASGSCLLTDIVDSLQELSRKINIVDYLSKHLAKDTPKNVLKAYLAQVKKWCLSQPVIHIDDGDVLTNKEIKRRCDKSCHYKDCRPGQEENSICYYRSAKGISGILSYAKEGIKFWFRTKRPVYCQLRFKLTV